MVVPTAPETIVGNGKVERAPIHFIQLWIILKEWTWWETRFLIYIANEEFSPLQAMYSQEQNSNMGWLITLSNVILLQTMLLWVLFREAPLSNEWWQLQSHSYPSECLEKIMVTCSAPNKTLIPSFLRFRGHCPRRGGEKLRIWRLGEGLLNTTFWKRHSHPRHNPQQLWMVYTVLHNNEPTHSQAQMDEGCRGPTFHWWTICQ